MRCVRERDLPKYEPAYADGDALKTWRMDLYMYVLYISIQMCIYRHIDEYEPAYADGDDLEHICLKMYTHEPIHAHTRICAYSHIYKREPISTHTHTRTCIPIYSHMEMHEPC